MAACADLGSSKLFMKLLDAVLKTGNRMNDGTNRTWVDSPGEMVLTNLTTGDKVLLYFQPCGSFGAGRYEVDGYVYSAEEEPKIMITEKWNKMFGSRHQECKGRVKFLFYHCPGTGSWR